MALECSIAVIREVYNSTYETFNVGAAWSKSFQQGVSFIKKFFIRLIFHFMQKRFAWKLVHLLYSLHWSLVGACACHFLGWVSWSLLPGALLGLSTLGASATANALPMATSAWATFPTAEVKPKTPHMVTRPKFPLLDLCVWRWKFWTCFLHWAVCFEPNKLKTVWSFKL